MAEHWIKDAHLKEGTFTKKAHRAGESVAEYAKDKKDAPGKLGKQARLAAVLRGLSKAREK